jgi:hypothetical protein
MNSSIAEPNSSSVRALRPRLLRFPRAAAAALRDAIGAPLAPSERGESA